MADDTGGYTIKDMLKIQQTQLDRIESKVDTIGEQKADKIVVERLAQRFDILERDGSQKAERALELSRSNEKRLDDTDYKLTNPEATPQGRQGLALVKQYETDHEFIEGIRTLVALAKFLGIGGLAVIAVALLSLYFTGHPIP